MYSGGETLNHVDRLFEEMNPKEQEAVVAQRHAGSGSYVFDAALRKV